MVRGGRARASICVTRLLDGWMGWRFVRAWIGSSLREVLEGLFGARELNFGHLKVSVV